MINDVTIYINNTKVDTFGDEGVAINDSIKKYKDPKKIFTQFSAPFTLPSSPTNNILFSHWYNPDISGGFDARKYQAAELRIGGMPFRKGTIVLNNVKMKDKNPELYNVTFIGQGRNLTDLIGEDKLASLSGLDQYNHDYSAANVLTGFVLGLNESGGSMVAGTGAGADVIYPLIYHPPDVGFTLEIDITPSPDTIRDQNSKGVYYHYLKPSIKVLNVIDEIEAKYGITFSSDFLTTSNAAVDDLYLHLHNKAGQLVGGDEYQEKLFDYTANTFSAFAEPTETQTVLLDLDINVDTGTGEYGVQVIDDNTGEIVMNRTASGSSTPTSFNTELSALDRDYNFKVRVFTEGGITQFDITNFTVTERLVDSGGTTDTDTVLATYSNQTLVSTIKITSQIPDIKIMDFLTGIFQTFNLVAYYTSDTEIYVDTLDDFYAASSVEWDLNSYVESDEHLVKKSQLYKIIDFGWKSSGSYLVTRRNEITNIPKGMGYGFNLFQDDGETFVFDGGEYKIELPFEKVLFEQEDASGTYRNILWGLYLDDDETDPKEYKGEPLVFYARYLTLGASDPTIELWNASDAVITNGTVGNGQTHDDYFAPCNQNTEESFMINWDSEIVVVRLSVSSCSVCYNCV